MVHRRLERRRRGRVSAGIRTSHAILLLSGRYVLQLRDDKPTISAPGVWSLFGGAQGRAETALQAVRREVYEELSIEPPRFTYLWSNNYYDEFHRGMVRISFFVSEVDAVWSGHRLTEGQDVGVFSYDDLERLAIPSVIREAITRFHRNKDRSGSCRTYESPARPPTPEEEN